MAGSTKPRRQRVGRAGLANTCGPHADNPRQQKPTIGGGTLIVRPHDGPVSADEGGTTESRARPTKTVGRSAPEATGPMASDAAVSGGGGVSLGAVARAEAALRAFAREPGRSVAVRVVIGDLRWAAQVAGDEPRPGASLLKLPLAMAVEQAMGVDSYARRTGRPAVDGFVAGGPAAAELAADETAMDGPLTAAVRVGELIADWPESTLLRALDPGRPLQAVELLRFMVSSSDGPSARWLLAVVGLEAVAKAIAQAGCTSTHVELRPGSPGGPLTGTTTANDAMKLLAAALDEQRHPITAGALADSTLNSRIPLGVQRRDIAIAHKTGTLFGVAHDVAMLDVSGGQVWLAFLSDAQHDTLVTGYEMGLCTQEVLAAFGLGVLGSRSADGT